MSKIKVCKKCKLFVEGDVCPLCKRDQFTSSWQGRLTIVTTENSKIASELSITEPGEYAIKTR